jgi:hypothetical protein
VVPPVEEEKSLRQQEEAERLQQEQTRHQQEEAERLQQEQTRRQQEEAERLLQEQTQHPQEEAEHTQVKEMKEEPVKKVKQRIRMWLSSPQSIPNLISRLFCT